LAQREDGGPGEEIIRKLAAHIAWGKRRETKIKFKIGIPKAAPYGRPSSLPAITHRGHLKKMSYLLYDLEKKKTGERAMAIERVDGQVIAIKWT